MVTPETYKEVKFYLRLLSKNTSDPIKKSILGSFVKKFESKSDQSKCSTEAPKLFSFSPVETISFRAREYFII